MAKRRKDQETRDPTGSDGGTVCHHFLLIAHTILFFLLFSLQSTKGQSSSNALYSPSLSHCNSIPLSVLCLLLMNPQEHFFFQGFFIMVKSIKGAIPLSTTVPPHFSVGMRSVQKSSRAKHCAPARQYSSSTARQPSSGKSFLSFTYLGS